ncbi:MAG: precorrin-2 C(20)-methyltransferase [Bacteroidaceae bacterium]|nr:precorrin-2 C(20)-methyltransferase [Bacteroidaceae bacterium]MBR1683480.1 precorrin-2 C(20)-methyltransferase [Bacteroidaceae bacterium]
MKTNITFLSLGPGDPELLTLKAVRLLREADIVMVPATTGRDAAIHSRAADIIGEWCTADKIRYVALPMQQNRDAVRLIYDQMCRQAAEWYHEGLRVVVAVEGDVSIYASIHYVLERLQALAIPVEQCPGIPSFIAAAASAGLSLISQRQRLVVVPGEVNTEALRGQLTSQHVVVIMKLSQCEQELKDYLRQYPDTICHYFENVGTQEAFHSCSHDVILQRQIPYFALCILLPT